MAFFRVGSEASGFQATLDTTMVERAIEAAPMATYRRMRSFVFQCALDHRKAWLQVKGSRFGRGSGEKNKPIGVSQIQFERKTPNPNEVLYFLKPSPRRASSAKQAGVFLNNLSSEIFTGNAILPIHEFGTDIRSKRGFMSVPIRTRLGASGRGLAVTPGNWRKANPGKILTLRRGRGGVLFLYEVVPVFSRANKRKGIEKQHIQDRLKMRFMLTRKVEMNPTLQFYSSWAKTEPLRSSWFKKITDKLQEDLDRGEK